MKNRKLSRRDVLMGATVVAASATFSTRVMASSPPPEPVTQALIDAATKEGAVSYYTSTDLPVAEKVAKAFEAKYPGIKVHTERTGAECKIAKSAHQGALRHRDCGAVVGECAGGGEEAGAVCACARA